jgi:hypothetical protein
MKTLARIINDEIEVEVDAADLLSDMLDQFDDDTMQAVACSLSTMHVILVKIPDRMIKEFSANGRDSVYCALLEQANRWKPQAGGEG